MSITIVVDTGMLQEILKEVKSTQVKFTRATTWRLKTQVKAKGSSCDY